MLLETAEELAQLALGVVAIYLALRLVLRLQQSPWGRHVERRRAAVVCLLALLVAAAMVTEDTVKGQSGPVDTAVLLWVRAHVPMALTPWFEAVTFTASSTVLTPLTVIAAAALLAIRERIGALLLAGSVVCAALLVYGMKVAIGRERPALWDTQWYWGSSFPSGHTLVVAAFATSAALIAGHLWPAARVTALAVALSWTLLVGLSRLVLGVHWPTDVTMAASLGMAIPLGFGLALEARHLLWERNRTDPHADSEDGGR